MAHEPEQRVVLVVEVSARATRCGRSRPPRITGAFVLPGVSSSCANLVEELLLAGPEDTSRLGAVPLKAFEHLDEGFPSAARAPGIRFRASLGGDRAGRGGSSAGRMAWGANAVRRPAGEPAKT